MGVGPSFVSVARAKSARDRVASRSMRVFRSTVLPAASRDTGSSLTCSQLKRVNVTLLSFEHIKLDRVAVLGRRGTPNVVT